MHALFARPWLSLALLLAGIAVAYTAFVLRSGNLQAAGGYCPAKQICADGACDKNTDCADGRCDGVCPHCKQKTV